MGIAYNQRERKAMLCIKIPGLSRFPPKLKREVWISLNAFTFEIKRADIVGGFGFSSIRKWAPDVQRLNKVLLFVGDNTNGEGPILGEGGCACG